MLFRYRRYRAFLAFTVIAVFALYYFSGISEWATPSAIGAGSLKQLGISITTPAAQAGSELVKDAEKLVDFAPQEPIKEEVKDTIPVTPAPEPKATHVANALPPLPAAPSSSKIAIPAESPNIVEAGSPKSISKPPVEVNYEKELSEIGEGRLDVAPAVSLSVPAIHWTKQTQHFPVTSTIEIPRGSPKAISQIQHKFGKETDGEISDRKQKLKAIKDAATSAWKGYRDNAWMHDEVRPNTGGSRDPFCGWAATMVDALDTLWIMGMKEEFEEAVRAVGKLDFTTSTRKDIPLFETTIRYLGGLLSAYDVSNAKYRTLLDKAVELAEILMGAFDTPNRMPVTYYRWMPAFASQPHRAGTRVVLAEIGSLSVEFTRLAQLTREPKYYDAIDRITDAFVEWQDVINGTLLPGMWPVYVDATGCDKPKQFHDGTQGAGAVNQQLKPNAGNAEQSTRIQIDKVGQQDALEAERKLNEAKAAKAGRPQVAGQAGKGKIAAWGDPVEEGSLDNKAAMNQFLDKEISAIQQNTNGVPVQAVAPGKGKIMAWGDPIEEGVLDHQAAKDQVLGNENKASAADTAPQAGGAGKAKIMGWGEPVEEGSVDSKAAKVNLLGKEYDTTKQKRQLTGDLSEGRRPAPKEPGLTDFSFGEVDLGQKQTKTTSKAASAPTEVCIPRGLVSSNRHGSDHFTLGGMSDSMYEYLPKQWLLLGGLEDKYRTMYEKSMDAVIDKLLYRPMTPDNLDILMSGDYYAYSQPDVEGKMGLLKTEGAHLTCFAGGMFAMGAKIFNRKQDLAIGAKLTEGCIWAYNSTVTGIMPEDFLLLACDDKVDCQWNKTKYYDALDPYKATRTTTPKLPKYPDVSWPPAPTPMALDETAQVDTAPRVPNAMGNSGHHKRQVDGMVAAAPVAQRPAAAQPGSRVEDAVAPAPLSGDNYITYSAPPPLTHEEFVAGRIEDERLPPGFLRITSKKYILR